MKRTFFYIFFVAVFLGILEFVGRCDFGEGFSLRKTSAADELRVGYFPNITHAQALIAQQMEREGRSWYASRLPAGTKLSWQLYNAGPSAMEGLTIDSIDLTYVGPSPAINAFLRRDGAVRLIAGSAEGGAALVASANFVGQQPKDFIGHRIATPQLGNTQDVACRAWLSKNNVPFNRGETDSVQVVPTKNPDQLALFKSGDLEAAWTVEPWVSRLELEAKAHLVKEDFDSVTTVLATSTQSLAKRRNLIDAFVKGHNELTAWINAHPDEAKAILQRALSRETHSDFPEIIVRNAFPRIVFTEKLDRRLLNDYVAAGLDCGALPSVVDVEKMLDTTHLDLSKKDSGVFPLPSEIAVFLWESVKDLSLFSALLVTMRRLFVGYLIGFAIALPMGLLLSQSAFVRNTLGVLALAFQGLPSVCWVPISLVIFGQDEWAILTVVVMGSVWSLMLATENGIRSVPPLYLRAAATMGSKRFHLWTRVMFPAALPLIFSGMKQGWAFAWRSLMSAEIYVYIFSGIGLGWMLNAGREEMNVAKVYGVMLVIIVIGLVMERLCFAPIERFLRERWGLEK
ncbi:MAG: ABC transporter substrate-binding protein [Opitutales bacterium]|nr:ABC transporter substrate-binding protein [Opitutales bacterium]